MRIEHRHEAFRDQRGTIVDLVSHQVFEHATLVASVAGAVRGNHVHPLSTQAAFVLAGRLRVLAQVPGGPVEARTVDPGTLVTHDAGEAHTFIALEDAVFLVLTHGPRGGVDFESDTIRVPPLQDPEGA